MKQCASLSFSHSERKRVRGWQDNTRLLAVACVSLGVVTSARADNCTPDNCTISDLYNGTEVTVKWTTTDVQITHIYGMEESKQSTDYFTSGPTPLFSFALNQSAAKSPGKLTNVDCHYLKGVLGLDCTATSADLKFAIQIWPFNLGSGYPPFNYGYPPAPPYGVAYPVIGVTVQVTYTGPDATALFNVMLPKLKVTVPGAKPAMAMVPQMVGGVMPLANAINPLGAVGNSGDFKLTNQPTALNALELAALYDGSGKNGGVFFADVDGDYRNNVAPLQFTLTRAGSDAEVTGYWTAKLKRGQPMTMPRLAIGTHKSGDWHYAVDCYRGSHSWAFPDTPKWLREAGAIYLLGVAGGGSFLNTFPDTPINDPHFGMQTFAPTTPVQRCLQDVYNDAQKLGTNVIYLTEWWDPPAAQPWNEYGNKGDYVVRQDMGGAAGLKAAVDQIHKVSGKVILYLEPYHAAETSILMQPPTPGQTPPPGPGWARQPTGLLTTACPSPSPLNCMSITNTQWQDYLINRAVNLVQETHVDGFFLDVWGFRMNTPANTTSENVAYSGQQWSAAALRFVDRLRAKLRSINPDNPDPPIVMGENNGSEFPVHWDGGSAADLSFWPGNKPLYTPGSYFQNSQGRLWGSPVRYAMPLANFFINGSGIDSFKTSTPTNACDQPGYFNGSAIASVNQVIASGHNLALGPFFRHDVTKIGTVTSDYETITYPPPQCTPSGIFPPPASPQLDDKISNYIQSVVQIRNSKTCNDALIYGDQLPMPVTTPPSVVAYLYQGAIHQVLAIVNIGSTAASNVQVTLDKYLGTREKWVNVPISHAPTPNFSQKVITDHLVLTFPEFPAAETLGGVVILKRPCDTACGVPASFGPNVNTPLMNESFSTAPPYGTGLSNWTDLGFSGKNAVSAWSTGTTTETTKVSKIETSFLQASAVNKSALLFYDLFGGGDFTYVGGITVTSFGATGSSNPMGLAGLSFRLSYNDDPKALDAGNMGYDVVLTNDPITSGSVRLLKRQPTSGGPPTSTVLCQAGFGVAANRTYQLSITAQNSWTPPPQFGAPSPDPNQNAYPVWPVSSTFTVSVDGTQLFTCTDSAPYFSGRFGVNATNVNAQFSCLQANGPEDSDGPMPPTCAPTIIRTLPPPGQGSQDGNGPRVLR